MFLISNVLILTKTHFKTNYNLLKMKQILSKISKKLISKKNFLFALTLSGVGLSLDLYSKYIILQILSDQNGGFKSIEVTSFFSLIYVKNLGISFGMFNNIANAREIFIVIQGLIATSLIIWLFYCQKFYISVALGLIIGGAYGNVIDRYFNGGVTDFLDFHYKNFHYPAFNLADSLIFIGVVIILIDEFFLAKKS